MVVAIARPDFHTVCMSSRSAAPRLRPHIRVSDADRERVADVLRRCAGEGRLTPDELEDRLDGAYRAVYGSDLDALVADLPAAHPAPSMARRRPGVRRREGGVAIPLVVVGLLAALVPGVAWMAMLAALFFGVFFAAATLAALGVAFAPVLVVLAVALATRRRRRARVARHAPHHLPYDERF